MTSRRTQTVSAIDLFAGFGGSSAGIHASGADLILAANHWERAIQVHADNFPDTDHVRADIVDPDASDWHDPKDLPECTFLSASPSCTHHSQANSKKSYETGATLFDMDNGGEDPAYLNSERSRVSMVAPLRYAAQHRPELVMIENVVEVAHWGPNRDGTTFRWWLSEWEKLGYEFECVFVNSMFFAPCPQSRDRIYICLWRRGNRRPNLDYRPVSYCVSDRCAGRHVEAVQSWKPRTKSWPLPRWGKYRAQYVYRCPECGVEVHPAAWPAATAIDFTDLGPKLSERDRPLAPRTLERIRRGLIRFRFYPPVWLDENGAFRGFGPHAEDSELLAGVVPNRTHGSARHASESLPTLVAGTNSVGVAGTLLPVAGNTHERPGQLRAKPLIDPMFTQHTTLAFGFATQVRGGDATLGSQSALDEALRTVTTKNGQGLVTAFSQQQNGGPGDTAPRALHDPLPTMTAKLTNALTSLAWVDQYGTDPAAVSEALATFTTRAGHALASVEDGPEPDLDEVRFRMLKPSTEIRAAMAFPVDYRLSGNQTEVTAGLGNAVTPPVSAWISERMLATLDPNTERSAA
ncbi:MAG: DNA cytosine methyltransferase [Actinomycetota bacterium]